MANRILITGFPHCGTTILRSIMGNCRDTYEHLEEVRRVNPSVLRKVKGEKNIVIKFPFLPKSINSVRKLRCPTIYKGYKIVFIIRDPHYVFSSLNRRFDRDLEAPHDIDTYLNFASLFCELESEKIENVYLIRYEQLFTPILGGLLTDLGLEYSPDVLLNINQQIKYRRINLDEIEESPPDRDHGRYRIWQINQPLRNMDSSERINLRSEQLERLNCDLVARLGYLQTKN